MNAARRRDSMRQIRNGMPATGWLDMQASSLDPARSTAGRWLSRKPACVPTVRHSSP
jgi:hypothetical protein